MKSRIFSGGLTIIGLTFTSSVIVEAGEYYIERDRTDAFTATLRATYRFPSISEGMLTVFAPTPPNTDSQEISSSKLVVNGIDAVPGVELNQSRQMLGVRLKSNQLRSEKEIKVRTEYRGKLFSRELKKGRNNSDIVELDSELKHVFTSKTDTMNWGDSVFTGWLSNSGLIKKSF